MIPGAPLDGGAAERLMDAFSLDDGALRILNQLGVALREHAPEALSTARGESALAGATSAFFLPLLPAGMSEQQKALLAAISAQGLARDTLRDLLAGWASSLNPEEPRARVQRDCRPLQELLRTGALRVYAADRVHCEAALAAAERFGSVQAAMISESMARAARPGTASTPGGAPPGQDGFLAQLGASIGDRRADGGSLALLCVDCGIVGRIDRVWGYAVGDGVRERLGGRLRSEVLRQRDFLGDAGRDRFACVLETVQSEGVALLAAEKVLRSLDAPVWVGDSEVYARPAIGIALFAEHGEQAETLLQHASTACLVARERPDRIAVYAEAQARPEAELLAYENRLRAAIAQDALDLVFQPQVEFRGGGMVGAESLLRWRDGDLGVVPVEKAIAAAESAGLVNEVTLWMLNNALRNCKEFRDAAGLDLRIGVNLSAKCLREPDLADFVARALKTWNLRPSRLALEIAETALLRESGEARQTLERLKALGVRLSIDDFGAGYASLAYLATLSFHELKIDFAPLSEDVPQQSHVLRSLIELAHQLKLEVVAVGVPDQALADRLKELGCDVMQGAHVGAPLDSIGFIRTHGN